MRVNIVTILAILCASTISAVAQDSGEAHPVPAELLLDRGERLGLVIAADAVEVDRGQDSFSPLRAGNSYFQPAAPRQTCKCRSWRPHKSPGRRLRIAFGPFPGLRRGHRCGNAGRALGRVGPRHLGDQRLLPIGRQADGRLRPDLQRHAPGRPALTGGPCSWPIARPDPRRQRAAGRGRGRGPYWRRTPRRHRPGLRSARRC